MQVSRDKNLKIPKKLEDVASKTNSVADVVAIKHAISMSNNKKINIEETTERAKEKDTEWENVSKIPAEANDLMVITVVKKLGAYIIAVTQKSPTKFRATFVNRMQNYAIDILENLILANFITLNSIENHKQRETLQEQSIARLKLLGYIAMVSESVGCILPKQYRQISMQVGQAINMIVAWRKSDGERIKNSH